MNAPAHFKLRTNNVDAIQYTGGNVDEVKAFAAPFAEVVSFGYGATLMLMTKYGERDVGVGDWVVKHSARYFDRMRDGDFHGTYEVIE